MKAVDDEETHKGWTPLFFAIVSGPNGHPEIVNLLLRNSANVNARDSFGRTPLHYASELGQDDSIEMLLSHDANPNISDVKTKKTALLLAIENGQFNSVQLLWNHCNSDKSKFKLDLTSWDEQG